MHPPLDLQVLLLGHVSDHPLDVTPWTHQRVSAQRWITVQKDEDLRVLVNHRVRAAILRVTVGQSADETRALARAAFIRLNVEGDAVGHAGYNEPAARMWWSRRTRALDLQGALATRVPAYRWLEVFKATLAVTGQELRGRGGHAERRLRPQ